MTEQKHEFGKRRPAPPRQPLTTPPIKRSRHVALLLTGTVAVGSSAFGLMTGLMALNRPCEPTSPGMAAPAVPPADGACTSRGSSSGGGGSHGFRFFSGGSDRSSSSSHVADASSSQISRGGFGSFGEGFGFSRGG